MMRNETFFLVKAASLFVLGLSLFLNGCQSPQPKAEREPDFAYPQNWSAGLEESRELSLLTLLGVYDDSQLNALAEEVLAHNYDLKVAVARWEESRFLTRRANGGRLPRFTGGASGSRGKTVGGLPTSETFQIDVNASWEVDLWGKLAAGVKAARLDEARFQKDWEFARRSIVAQSIQAWFDWVAAKLILEVGQRQLESRQNTEDLILDRYESGTGALGDWELARTDKALALADVQNRQDAVKQQARALEVLLGRYPDGELAAEPSLPVTEKPIPVGIPSEILSRRPDLESAFLQIQAADARTKVAYRDLFPSLVLTASGGRQSNAFEDLMKSGFDVWSIAGQLSAPLWEGGVRRAELGAAGQRAEIAYQEYQNAVLQAFSEVETALDTEHWLSKEEAAVVLALEHARRAEQLNGDRYEQGLIDILTLLDTQRRVFSTEERLVNVRNARLRNRIALALALGVPIE